MKIKSVIWVGCLSWMLNSYSGDAWFDVVPEDGIASVGDDAVIGTIDGTPSHTNYDYLESRVDGEIKNSFTHKCLKEGFFPYVGEIIWWKYIDDGKEEMDSADAITTVYVTCMNPVSSWDYYTDCIDLVANGEEPEANGCGAAGGVPIPDFNFTAPCNNHDDCYSTCLNSKDSCDGMFKHEMMEICFTLPIHKEIPCVIVADIYYAAVQGLGTGAYRSAQMQVCKCCELP